jgi:hypothetical protein
MSDTNNLLLDTVGGWGRWFRKEDRPAPPKAKTYWHPKKTDGKVSWLPSDNSNDSVYNVALEHEKTEIRYWEQQLKATVMGSEEYKGVSRILYALKQPSNPNKILATLNKDAKNLYQLQPGAVYSGKLDIDNGLWIDRQGLLYHFPFGSYKVIG